MQHFTGMSRGQTPRLQHDILNERLSARRPALFPTFAPPVERTAKNSLVQRQKLSDAMPAGWAGYHDGMTDMPQAKAESGGIGRHCSSPEGCSSRRRSGGRGEHAEEGPLRDRRDPAARPRAAEDVRVGDPRRAARAPRSGHAGRGAADVGARQPRRPRARDGGRRELQRRMGIARRADLAHQARAQAPLSHRRLRRLGHRLCGGLQGEALEGRRRGRHPLQPGRRRRRGVQRRRPDVLARRSASGATRRRTARSPSSRACRTASCWRGRGT